jgi:hypothetical protein
MYTHSFIKKQYNILYGFTPKLLKKYFQACFLPLLQNFVMFRPPVSSGHEDYFGASFELFARKFGHLETVGVNYQPRKQRPKPRYICTLGSWLSQDSMPNCLY